MAKKVQNRQLESLQQGSYPSGFTDILCWINRLSRHGTTNQKRLRVFARNIILIWLFTYDTYDTKLCHDDLCRKKIRALIRPRTRAGYCPVEYVDRSQAVARQRLMGSNTSWIWHTAYNRCSVAESASEIEPLSFHIEKVYFNLLNIPFRQSLLA